MSRVLLVRLAAEPPTTFVLDHETWDILAEV